jgi:hypothetical protein
MDALLISKEGTNVPARAPPHPKFALLSNFGLSRGEASNLYPNNPFFFANSFSDTCGLAPMCWITSAAASAPSRPAFS